MTNLRDEESVLRWLSSRYGLAYDLVDTRWLNPLVEAMDSSGASEEDLETAIVSAATVNESMFLRHPRQFAWITDHWLPETLARLRDTSSTRRKLRVLSAPCASGEEPYSLYATLQPLLPEGWSLDVQAVDISARCLQHAKTGHYTLWSLRGVPVEDNQHWLTVGAGGVEVHEWVRESVSLTRHNLLEALPHDWQFDLVVCRNMLFYFHAEAIERTWRTLLGALAPGGTVLLGPSDPAPPASVPVHRSWEHGVRLFRREPAAVHTPAPPRTAAAPPRAPLPRPAPPPRPPTRPRRITARPAPAPDPPGPSSQLTPDDIGQRYQAARSVAGQQPAIAVRLLEQLHVEAPLHVPTLLTIALLASEQSDHALAVQRARAAAFLSPDAPYTQFVAGDAFERAGAHAQAVRCYRWATTLLADVAAEVILEYSEGIEARQLMALLRERRLVGRT